MRYARTCSIAGQYVARSLSMQPTVGFNLQLNLSSSPTKYVMSKVAKLAINCCVAHGLKGGEGWCAWM